MTITDDAKEFSKDNNVTIVEFNGNHLGGFQAMTKINKITDFLMRNKM